MGIKFMALAIDANVANSGQRLVLLMLANHCNDHTRQCNPSHKLLAEECKMGLSTLKGHINALVDSGLVSIQHVYKDNQQRPNSYILNFDTSQNLATPPARIQLPTGQNLATEPEVEPKKIKRATRLPEGFIVPDDWICWARANRPDLDLKVVAESFVDYWISRGDAGAAKLDWLATWRNWIRNAKMNYNAPAKPTANKLLDMGI